MLHTCLSPKGSQQSNALKDALDAEMEKTKEMEESMKKLDEEMKRYKMDIIMQAVTA